MTTDENPENTPSASPYLTAMIDKLDNVPKGNRGYVAQAPELKGILSELTERMSLNIWRNPTPYLPPEQADDMIEVQVSFTFCLSRAEMAELEERKRQQSEGKA